MFSADKVCSMLRTVMAQEWVNLSIICAVLVESQKDKRCYKDTRRKKEHWHRRHGRRKTRKARTSPATQPSTHHNIIINGITSSAAYAMGKPYLYALTHYSVTEVATSEKEKVSLLLDSV